LILTASVNWAKQSTLKSGAFNHLPLWLRSNFIHVVSIAPAAPASANHREAGEGNLISLNKNMRRGLLATHKSAEKRDRQSTKRRERNIAAKSALKTKIKAVLGAVGTKNKEASAQALKETIPSLARAAVKGIIHKKNASRKISRLTKKINSLQG